MTHEPGAAPVANPTSSPGPVNQARRPPSTLPAQATPGPTDLHAPAGPDPAGPEADRPAPGEPTGRPDPTAGPDRSPFTVGTVVLAVLALLWLAGMLWAAQATIAASEITEMIIVYAAYALPGAVSAGLVGGAALALVVLSAVDSRPVGAGRLAGTPTRRFALATVAGLATGLLATTVVLLSSDGGDAIAVLAGTVAAAGTIGGALAGIRAARVVAAVVAAGLTVFVVGFLFSRFQVPLLSMFGSGESEASRASAAGWFSLTASLSSGLGAGLVSYGYLRRTGRHTDAATPRWPAYAVAGAGPGLLLLITELLVRTAGARALAMAGAVSEADQSVQTVLGVSRVNNALVVLFVGAIIAILAVGRTMRPATDAEPAAPARS
ncbi:MAG TPA: proline-rich domain-containing protein [Catenuloplanes sp.]|jgi:hypothetical protein